MDAHDIDAPHVVPLKVYLGVFTALMVLTAITVTVAFMDLGAMNNVVMLGVAITKATLVILYFMHVRYSSSLTGAVVLAGVAFVVLMVAGTLMDLLSRGWVGFPGG
jgi:cytochrome c oxidase subunit 4